VTLWPIQSEDMSYGKVTPDWIGLLRPSHVTSLCLSSCDAFHLLPDADESFTQAKPSPVVLSAAARLCQAARSRQDDYPNVTLVIARCVQENMNVDLLVTPLDFTVWRKFLILCCINLLLR